MPEIDKAIATRDTPPRMDSSRHVASDAAVVSVEEGPKPAKAISRSLKRRCVRIRIRPAWSRFVAPRIGAIPLAPPICSRQRGSCGPSQIDGLKKCEYLQWRASIRDRRSKESAMTRKPANAIA
jgi:hypothetical protein